MVKIHFVSYIVLIIIVPRVICSQNTYIRAIPLDDDANMSKFSEIFDYPGDAKSVIACSGYALNKKTQSAPNDEYINAFMWDKANGVCKVGTVPYTKLGELAQKKAIKSEDQGGVYVQQGCYLQDMPFTTDEADPDLELYYKGPEIELKRFDSGATTVTPATTDPAKWIQGRQFIYTGRYGLQISDTAGENKFDFIPSITTPDLTLLVWYYIERSALIPGNRLIATLMPVVTSDAIFNLATSDDDNHLVSFYFEQSSGTFAQVGNDDNDKVLLAADKWTHVGVVKSGSTLTFFVNGDQVKSEVTAPTMNGFNDLGHLFIGGTIDANVCKCHLAEMEIFSRAISDQEVKESYDRFPKSGPCVP